MITHLVHVPIFNCAVFFVGDCDRIQAMDAVYRLKGKGTQWEIPAASGAVLDINGDVFCWVGCMEKGSTMMHELTHVACSIMETRNIPQCRDTEEVMCYLVGWLKLNVMDKVYEKREKRQSNQIN